MFYVQTLWTHLRDRIDGVMTDESTFEQLSAFMADSKNIKLTASFYTMLRSLCTQSTLHKDESAENAKLARLLLSALMIARFPLDVMDVADVADLDPFSCDCHTAATQMLDAIGVKDKPHRLQMDALLKAMELFLRSFAVWKEHDLAKVLDSVKHYYREWQRSYQLLSRSGMNEQRKKAVLNSLATNLNRTQSKMAKLVGADKAKAICRDISAAVEAEPDIDALRPHHEVEAEETENEEQKEEAASLEQQLAAKGIPMDMRSGRNLLVKDKSTATNSKCERYVKEVDGRKVLDLDRIVLEEASKNYWRNFSEQIGNGEHSLLFQVLSELLERLKVQSPQKDHAHLDDLMDVAFIEQTIEKHTIDAQAFYGIFRGIWAQIKSLHAPQEDEAWQRWHDEMLESFSADDASWGAILSTIINMFLVKLDRIEDQVAAIKAVQKAKKAD